MTRTLVVTADDYGLTPGVCEAVLVAGDRGVVTSTSALVVAPAWEHYAHRLASSGLGVGAHLCVVGEDPPLLTAAEVPSLVDGRGRFPGSWRQFVARAARGRVDDDDLRRELDAQLQALIGAGIRPTHLDSHQNLHLWPSVSKVMFELAERYSITAARVPRTRRWTVSSVGVRVLARRFEAGCARRGVRLPETSAGLDEAGTMTIDRFEATVAMLGHRGAGSAEIGTHPGLADDPDRARYRWGYGWSDELDALCDDRARSAVERAGFVLGTFADLTADAATNVSRGDGATA